MAAKTLLDCVNEILRKKGLISGDAALLSSLTNSSRQAAIDLAVQVVNEGIDDIYSVTKTPIPNQLKESSIALVGGTRAYTLPSDMVQMYWPLIDRTNRLFIQKFAGGYLGILNFDIGQVFTGIPMAGAIRPSDGLLFLDRAPTADLAGRTYYLQYDKDLGLSGATDQVPFGNSVFRSMVPVWTQMWARQKDTKSYDPEAFKEARGTAISMMTQEQPRENYNPRSGVGYYINSTDPMQP